VILVDASRTMGIATAGGAFKNARTALATAAGSIPEGANIAVLRFDDEVPTVQEFTQSKEAISKAIDGLRAKGFGNSCLNDGLYEAVNKLGGAPGRRAVLVFTASADNCANRTPLDVINLAHQNRVQIYAAGLQGYAVTAETLQALAEPTGGLAELKPDSTLGFGLGNLTAVLNNQWSARATVYPSAGEQAATLKINLKDGVSLTSPPIVFNSSQDYVPPTEIHLQGTVQSVGDGILFNLSLIQPEKIRQLNVSIIDKSTGQSVMAQALLSFSEVNTIPAVSLFTGQEYTLIVSAVDANGQVLSEASLEFEYTAPQARLTISDVQTSAEQPDLLVTVSSLNLEGAVKFRAWLADSQSSVRLPETEVTVPMGDPILIPTSGLATGEYAVVVQALDSTDTVLAESPPVKTGYTRPGAFDSIRRTVAENPALVALGTAVLCLGVIGAGAAVFFILPRRGRRAEGVDLVMPQKARRAAPQTEKAVVDHRATPPRGMPRAPESPRARAPEPPRARAPEPPKAPPRAAPPRPAAPAKAAPQPAPRQAVPPPAAPKPVPPPAAQKQPAPAQQLPPAGPGVRIPKEAAPPAAPAQPPAAPMQPPPGPGVRIPKEPAPPPAAPQPAAVRSQAMRALPMARLSLIDPVAPQFGIEMKHSPFTIGRRTGNDAVVPVDSASGVSGSHLTLIFEEGQYFALDEKSTYGTTVNGQSLTKGQRFPLPDGAVIGLGPKVKLQIWFSPKP
jgi:hypothetical protein